jgi:hypothetical protein
MNPLRTSPRPADRDTIAALRLAGRFLGADCAWQLDGRFFFPLGDEWAVSISPDDAGRFRVGACYGRTEVATMWASTGDWDRLADLILALQAETAALAAS